MTESASRDAHPILPLAFYLTVQGAGVRMQQTLSAAVEHDLSEVFALHFVSIPSILLNRPFVAPLASGHTTAPLRRAARRPLSWRIPIRRLVIGESLAWI